MTKRYKKMCEIYKKFSESWNCDFSEDAMKNMYEFETFGNGDIEISGFNTSGKLPNGYAVGKKWLNVQVSAWRKDFRDNSDFGKMCFREVVREYPLWWVKSIFKEEFYWNLLK